MPNWCSNRMYFSGEPAQIAEIKRLASGAVTPFYRRATNEGIQLFLAGSAGLLQITENIRSEQCPGVTAAGRGAVSPENIALTRWLTHLQNGVLLDEQNCLMLHELWLQSGTGQRRWEELPDDVRETITVHFTAKRGDWCDIWGTRVLSDNESKVFFEKVKGQYPEMDIKIPFLTVMETLQYKPAESAAKVQCPVLIVIAGQDSVNPPEQGKALYDAVASGTKELYEEADACHYDIYEGAFFERVAAVQTQWFKKHL